LKGAFGSLTQAREQDILFFMRAVVDLEREAGTFVPCKKQIPINGYLMAGAKRCDLQEEF
jgi:hypothetical protein